MTSLHYASLGGHQHVVQLFLDRGANIDQKDKFGEFIFSIYLCIHHTINWSLRKSIYLLLYLMVYVSNYVLSIYFSTNNKIATCFAGKMSIR